MSHINLFLPLRQKQSYPLRLFGAIGLFYNVVLLSKAINRTEDTDNELSVLLPILLSTCEASWNILISMKSSDLAF
jgi:hypothetical protein